MADTWDVEEDAGLPEETQNQLEQENTVEINPRTPWRNQYGIWTVENVEDLYANADAFAVTNSREPELVLVLDNTTESMIFPEAAHYWVAMPTPIPDGTININVYPLVDYLARLRNEGDNLEGFVNNPPEGSVQITTFQGIPVFIGAPSIDYSRPETLAESSTSSTTGSTTTTTTTTTTGAAGTVTTSITVAGTVTANPHPPAAPSTNNLPPCLPNNPPASQASGSGATPPSTYDDAILRQARASSAAPSRTDTTDDARAARTNAQSGATAPTTVTAPPSTPTPNSTPAPSTTSTVYIYEPLTPGFDRYDFNSGKKVFTPDSGVSRTSSGAPVQQQTTPRVPPSAGTIDPNIAGGIS
jgi:hypothetical protein